MGEGSMLSELFFERLNYCIYVILFLIGLWAMLAKRNLIKKLIGMSIFQTAIILFYVSIAVKDQATIPIYLPEHDPHGDHWQTVDHNKASEKADHPLGPVALGTETIKGYANPLPHVLMLTAIVVGVATLGLALALTQRIYQGYGTIEEDELLEKLDRADDRARLSPVELQEINSNIKTPHSAKAGTSSATSDTGNYPTTKSSIAQSAKKRKTEVKSPTQPSPKRRPKKKN